MSKTCCVRIQLITNLRKFFSHKVNPNLICFKEWTPEMVTEILKSAKNLKKAVKCAEKPLMKKLQLLAMQGGPLRDGPLAARGPQVEYRWSKHTGSLATNCVHVIRSGGYYYNLASVVTKGLLNGVTVATIFELDEPVLKLAVSQGAHILGGKTSSITSKIMFDQEYMGRIFSMLSDMMFVSSSTHGCVQQFAAQAVVPVVCVRSRVHQTLQALATVMAIQEEYKELKGVRMAYVGQPAQVLNSYLLLCPMLGVHLNFICCCKEAPVHPVLFKAGTDLCEKSGTEVVECTERGVTLKDAQVVIAGPSMQHKAPKDIFQLDVSEIEKNTSKWIFIHTCPKGPEVTDELFQHKNARTLLAIENLRYVAAALMANSMKRHLF